jgi:hypothetical protein
MIFQSLLFRNIFSALDTAVKRWRSLTLQDPIDNYGILYVECQSGINAASVSHKRRSA